MKEKEEMIKELLESLEIEEKSVISYSLIEEEKKIKNKKFIMLKNKFFI